jgi:hypothetical protein
MVRRSISAIAYGDEKSKRIKVGKRCSILGTELEYVFMGAASGCRSCRTGGGPGAPMTRPDDGKFEQGDVNEW